MEHAKQIIAWELVLIFVFSSLLVIQSVEENGLSITGRAVQTPTKEAVRDEIKVAIPTLSFMNDITDLAACLIVNMGSTKYSYEILKVSGATDVSISDSLYCSGVANEDFIVSYINYDKLKSHLESTSFDKIKSEADGTAFYVLPSKQVESGMIVSNPDEFENKFGDFLDNQFSSSEVKAILSSKSVQTREPALMSYLYYVVVGIIAVVILLAVVFMTAKKPEVKQELEITAYIKASLAQGYQEGQIKQALIQGGWKADKIDEAFRQANSAVSAQETGKTI